MTTTNTLRQTLADHRNPTRAQQCQRFFKTAPGQYGHGDHFIGVPMPQIRKIAQQHKNSALSLLTPLLTSPIHEERALALIILVNQYKRKHPTHPTQIFDYYLQHIDHVNNWDLVDISAPTILGTHTYPNALHLRTKLSQSANLWHRRIAILACFYDIRQRDYKTILELATQLRSDPEDLIHKALGWMLREVSKRSKKTVLHFLDSYAHELPRTMLRYAIEHYTTEEKKHYMTQQKSNPK